MDSQSTVHTLFEKRAELHPAKPALLYENNIVTYKQLNQQANQLAHHLLSLGAKPNSPVAFCLERSIDCIVTMLAILKTGAAYMPLDTSFPTDRLNNLLQHSQAAILITESKVKNTIKDYGGNIIILDTVNLKSYSKDNLNISIPAHYLAYIIYTSGSTGIPKGALIEHAAVLNYAAWFADYTRVTTDERIDFSSNHCFDMAVTVTIVPLMLGLTTVFCENETKTNIRLYLHYLNHFKINLIKLTPSYFKLLLQEVQYQEVSLAYLKHIILGGENLTTKDCQTWLKIYPDHCLHNEYGPTEATVGVTQFLVNKDNVNTLGANVPIGKPGTQISCYILDKNNKPVEENSLGELHIGGICLARGYLNQPDLTDSQFIELPRSQLGELDSGSEFIRVYKTGDLCRFTAYEQIEYFGRMDAQVKIRGYRIDLGEIEQCLTIYPALSNGIVVAQKELTGTFKLVAYYILKANAHNPSVKSLRQHMQQLLPDFMIPSVFICLESFPLNANGKIQFNLLPKEAQNNLHFRAPVTFNQKKLTEFWSEELGLSQIGLDDDFFDLGGHSLAAARIVSKIYHHLEIELSMNEFYSSGTIERLSHLLDTKSSHTEPNNALTMESNALRLPLSDFQCALWITHRLQFNVNTLNITIRKRFKGQIDEEALHFAFNDFIKKQSVFSYQIALFSPTQSIKPLKPFSLDIKHLEKNTVQENKKILELSMEELFYYKKWKKNFPLILARLFYLKNDQVELQISLSHLISDDTSSQILLRNLSTLYCAYRNHFNHSIELNNHFKTYIQNEQDYIKLYLNRDIVFWKQYFNDTYLFQFPMSCVNVSVKSHYSTYKKVPEKHLKAFKSFCQENRITLYDGLSSVVAMALNPYCENKGLICINRVKSTRTEALFDDTLGCFLKVEPLKIQLAKDSTFDSILKDLQHSILETSIYQQSPTLIKLCSIKNFNLKKKPLLKSFLNFLVQGYSFLFSFPTSTKQILQECLSPLASRRPANDFLINLNMHRNFIEQEESNTFFSGLEEIPINNSPVDLLKIDGVLEVCFKRDDKNAAYVVISGNLKPKMRLAIANTIIEGLKSLGAVHC